MGVILYQVRIGACGVPDHVISIIPYLLMYLVITSPSVLLFQQFYLVQQ